jgi:type II restriction enzyme
MTKSEGWASDVLFYVQKIGRPDFTLTDVYGFEAELAKLHPENKHVKAKIRQQLQVLRDAGNLKFVAPGQYQLRKAKP